MVQMGCRPKLAMRLLVCSEANVSKCSPISECREDRRTSLYWNRESVVWSCGISKLYLALSKKLVIRIRVNYLIEGV